MKALVVNKPVADIIPAYCIGLDVGSRHDTVDGMGTLAIYEAME
jgi:hypothetical protein